VSKKPKLCAYCGLDATAGPMTTEHFAARCLWAGPRPQFTRTVPVHLECNRIAAVDAEYLRDVLVLEAGAAGHPVVQKHQETIRRKIDSGRLTRVLKGVGMRPVVSPAGLYLGHAPSFKIDQSAMDRALRNVMRGIYYSVNEVPLGQDVEFKIMVEKGDNLAGVQRIIDAMVLWQGFGDDVFACRYVFPISLPASMNCLMAYYRYRVFYGWACPKSLLDAADKYAAERMAALAV